MAIVICWRASASDCRLAIGAGISGMNPEPSGAAIEKSEDNDGDSDGSNGPHHYNCIGHGKVPPNAECMRLPNITPV
jgi:hypothetical protein